MQHTASYLCGKHDGLEKLSDVTIKLMVCLYDGGGGGVGNREQAGEVIWGPGYKRACWEACFQEAMGRVSIVCVLALHLLTGACGCMEFRRTPAVP